MTCSTYFKPKIHSTKTVRETQYGLRSARGTIDATFIVRQLIEKAKERNVALSFHFIDFKADFHMV